MNQWIHNKAQQEAPSSGHFLACLCACWSNLNCLTIVNVIAISVPFLFNRQEELSFIKKLKVPIPPPHPPFPLLSQQLYCIKLCAANRCHHDNLGPGVLGWTIGIRKSAFSLSIYLTIHENKHKFTLLHIQKKKSFTKIKPDILFRQREGT